MIFLKGYICSCKSGLKMIGCCVHVAMLIYYLSIAQYEELRFPANHLRSIFIDLDKKEQPNKPRYVRHKRLKLQIKESTVESSSSESDSERDDKDEIKDKHKEAQNETFEENNIEESGIEKKENIIVELIKRLPKNGAKIEYKNCKNITVINTCTIDYFLLGFWYLNTINNNIFKDNNLNNNLKIQEIISNIELVDWNKAKELWINDILNLEQPIVNKTISVFGSEERFFICKVREYQRHQLLQKCKENCIQNENLIVCEDAKNLFFKKIKNVIQIYSGFNGKCVQCHSKTSTIIKFYFKPQFIFIQSMFSDIKINELPEILIIDGNRYKLVCSTIHLRDHFIGVFKIGNKMHQIDDLDQSFIEYDESKNRRFTSNSLYYLI